MSKYEKFKWQFRQMRTLGVLQIILGTTSIIMSIPFVVVFDKRWWYFNTWNYNWDYTLSTLTYTCPGIWSGSFSLIAGIIGVMVSQKPSTCYVISGLIASLFSFFASMAMLGLEVTLTVTASRFQCFINPSGSLCNSDTNSNNLDRLVPSTFLFMFYLTMSLVALAVVFVSSIQTGYGCHVAFGAKSRSHVHPGPADNMIMSSRMAVQPQQAFLGQAGITVLAPQTSSPMQLYQLQPNLLPQTATQHTSNLNILSPNVTEEAHVPSSIGPIQSDLVQQPIQVQRIDQSEI